MSRFLPICAAGLAALSCQSPPYWKVAAKAEREADGRWIVQSPELPGIKAHGDTRREAISQWQPLGMRAVADDTEEGEFALAIKPFRPSGRLNTIVDWGLCNGTVYDGGVPGFISSTMGWDMGPGLGFDLSAGVRIYDRLGLKLGCGLTTADASDDSGDTMLRQRLGQFTCQLDVYFPLMPPRTSANEPNWRRELVLTATYVPDATLLDRVDDGFREGSGWGVAVLFRSNEPWWFPGRGKVSLGMGLGYRRLEFREYEVTGFGSSPVNVDLDMFSFLMGIEFWF